MKPLIYPSDSLKTFYITNPPGSTWTSTILAFIKTFPPVGEYNIIDRGRLRQPPERDQPYALRASVIMPGLCFINNKWWFGYIAENTYDGVLAKFNVRKFHDFIYVEMEIDSWPDEWLHTANILFMESLDKMSSDEFELLDWNYTIVSETIRHNRPKFADRLIKLGIAPGCDAKYFLECIEDEDMRSVLSMKLQMFES